MTVLPVALCQFYVLYCEWYRCSGCGKRECHFLPISGKLLTNIVCREHLGWGSGHTARKDRRNMPRLHTGYFTVRWFCLSRKDKANAERRTQQIGGALRKTYMSPKTGKILTRIV